MSKLRLEVIDDAPCSTRGARADGAPSEHASYTEHGTGKALAYGADWAHDEPVRHDGVDSGDLDSAASSAVYRAATCSFYDRALHLWSVGVAAATG